MNKLNAA